MAKSKSAGIFLVGGIALVSLTGCEKLEQAANGAVESAKQSAVKALDEARQAGSIEEARQSADRLLLDAKRQAAGLLEQASQYLSQEQSPQQGVTQVEEAALGESYPETAPRQ